MALLCACGPPAREPAPPVADLSVLLPSPSNLEGWSVAEGPEAYVPDTLYVYLDGVAPHYLSHGFQRLVHVRYASDGEPGDAVTLDVFDMGDVLGAFGIYRSILPPGVESRPWGAEGHREGAKAAAWKGRIYVHAEAGAGRPDLAWMMERLVAGVCERVPGTASLPAILEALPPGGLVPGSERYVGESLLGHAFLPGGLLATYEIGGGEAQLFYSDLGSEEAAAGAMERLRAHHSRWGGEVEEVSSPGAGGIRFTEPGLGSGTVVRAGPFIAGVQGDLPAEARERLLRRLLGQVSRSSL